MTKRKRTPPPSPTPRKRAVFEVPLSLWRFQAIARELAQQSEALPQQISNSQGPYPHPHPHPHSHGAEHPLSHAARFDAQAFKDNPLRFSPYSHHLAIVPSQPWPEAERPRSSTPTITSNAGSSAGAAGILGAEPALQDVDEGQISPGPDAQLFDELTNALHAGEAEGEEDRAGAASKYAMGDDYRITFDPHAPTDWGAIRTLPSYQQPMMQNNYPPMIPNSALPSSFSPHMAHHPSRLTSSNNNSGNHNNHSHSHNHNHNHNHNHSIMPTSPPNPSPIPFYPIKASPRTTRMMSTNPASKSSIPGYYKSSLKTWSQEGNRAQHPQHHTSSSSSLSSSTSPFRPHPSPAAAAAAAAAAADADAVSLAYPFTFSPLLPPPPVPPVPIPVPNQAYAHPFYGGDGNANANAATTAAAARTALFNPSLNPQPFVSNQGAAAAYTNYGGMR